MGAIRTHACHGSTREGSSRSAGVGEVGEKGRLPGGGIVSTEF